MTKFYFEGESSKISNIPSPFMRSITWAISYKSFHDKILLSQKWLDKFHLFTSGYLQEVLSSQVRNLSGWGSLRNLQRYVLWGEEIDLSITFKVEWLGNKPVHDSNQWMQHLWYCESNFSVAKTRFTMWSVYVYA